MNEQFWWAVARSAGLVGWAVARSAGLVGWALSAASVLWGLALSGKAVRRPSPGWVLDLHRFLGGASVIFTVVHVAGVLVDDYIDFRLVHVLVPFSAPWRPAAVAWGVVGLYLLAAVQITSLLRRRIPMRVWRRVHFASFAVYVTSTLHPVFAGTDASSPPVALLVAASLVGVVFLGTYRLLGPRRHVRSKPVLGRSRLPQLVRPDVERCQTPVQRR